MYDVRQYGAWWAESKTQWETGGQRGAVVRLVTRTKRPPRTIPFQTVHLPWVHSLLASRPDTHSAQTSLPTAASHCASALSHCVHLHPFRHLFPAVTSTVPLPTCAGACTPSPHHTHITQHTRVTPTCAGVCSPGALRWLRRVRPALPGRASGGRAPRRQAAWGRAARAGRS